MNMPMDAFWSALYTIVDDWYKAHAPTLLAGKAGKKPEFSDSEVITLSLGMHWLGYGDEREFLRFVRNNFLPFFPGLISQSQFNRRARNLLWCACAPELADKRHAPNDRPGDGRLRRLGASD